VLIFLVTARGIVAMRATGSDALNVGVTTYLAEPDFQPGGQLSDKAA
jgi:hypothetical protein